MHHISYLSEAMQDGEQSKEIPKWLLGDSRNRQQGQKIWLNADFIPPQGQGCNRCNERGDQCRANLRSSTCCAQCKGLGQSGCNVTVIAGCGPLRKEGRRFTRSNV